MIKWNTSCFSVNIVNKTIAAILFMVILANFSHGRFNKPDGVIQWDIKSYYAYLPAVFIYNDLNFKFRQDNIEKFGELIWPYRTPIGKNVILTTIGMSVIYMPFFLIAHGVALVTPYEADGYSIPYKFALTFSALFYLWLGLYLLAKVLRRYFSEKVIAFTLFAVAAGTNLFYYSSYEAPMAHAFNFTLITAFIWLTARFYDNPSIKGILYSGALAGFITLIRPTNIIVLLIFFLWDLKSWSDFKLRFKFYIKRFGWVLSMAGAFILIWVPQFIYWYWASGKLFYFTYSEIGGGFHFNNPQIYSILFSIKKGWLVYTPLMIFSILGIFMLPRRIPGLLSSMVVFNILNIYILASWWSWWYGGGFGIRSFVDSYGLLAIPLACFIDFSFNQKRWRKAILISMLAMIIAYNQFQIRQYYHAAIHWWWMNKEAYKETFLKFRPTERYWKIVTLPDYDAARVGIYRELKSIQEVEDEIAKTSGDENLYTNEKITQWLSANLQNDEILSQRMDSLIATNSDTIQVIRLIAFEAIAEKGEEYWRREMAAEFIEERIKREQEMVYFIQRMAQQKGMTFDEYMCQYVEMIYQKGQEKRANR